MMRARSLASSRPMPVVGSPAYFEKHGVQNYIGGNVLMEMSLAFWLKKPIYILNELPEESAFEEEIKGMEPVLLHGDVSVLPKLYVTGTYSNSPA